MTKMSKKRDGLLQGLNGKGTHSSGVMERSYWPRVSLDQNSIKSSQLSLTQRLLAFSISGGNFYLTTKLKNKHAMITHSLPGAEHPERVISS
jgi:hypothetical protein